VQFKKIKCKYNDRGCSFDNYYHEIPLHATTCEFAQKPVSIQKYNDNGFELFPNPTTGIVHVNLTELFAKNATFSLYNSLGQLIDNGIQLQNGNTLDLSYLPKGMYTLTVTSNGEFRSKKFVLQ
jgi:hypothetical protein